MPRHLSLLFLLGFWALPLAADCNSAPRAVDDAVGTFDTRSVWIDPLANDSDPDGQPLGLVLLGDTCQGTLTTHGDLFLYQPVVSQTESCTVTYRASDGSANDVATIHLTVTLLSTDIFADGFESGGTTLWNDTVNGGS